MMNASFLFSFFLIVSADAFVPATTTFVRQTKNNNVSSSLNAKTLTPDVDAFGNNIAVKNLLTKVENDKLLSKVAASGLLSKAQASGITLSKLEPLLGQIAENPDILVLVEASGPELLPLLPKIVDIAPGALPLLASAVSVPTPAIALAGIIALAGAAGAVVTIPDDTVVNIALQTLIVGLAVPAAGASFVGASILGKLK